MKKYNTYWLLVICCLLGCNFSDMNIDPTRQTSASVKELLPSAIAQTMRNMTALGNRVTGTVVQHYKGVDAQPEGYSNYLIDERTLDELWETGFYVGALRDCHLIIQVSPKDSPTYYTAISKVLMAVNLGIMTTYWGDIPYTSAFQVDAYAKATYDKQKDIYTHIQELLDEAIQILSLIPTGDIPAEDDLIFQGDGALWMATAYALKARYALHLTKRNPLAAQDALKFLEKGAFSSISEQPDFPFGPTLNEGQAFALYGIERPDQLTMGNYLQKIMIETDDPRSDVYFINKDNAFWIFDEEQEDMHWSHLDAPIPFISLAEVLFIEAEARLRLGQETRAEQAFIQAVQVHCDQVGLSSNLSHAFIEQEIHFRNCEDLGSKIEKLITQKYVALFVQGVNEAWVDYRRTGYPQLETPPNAHASFNPSQIIPRRYLYPISERLTNTANLQAAIDHQGGHLLDKDLWAFE